MSLLKFLVSSLLLQLVKSSPPPTGKDAPRVLKRGSQQVPFGSSAPSFNGASNPSPESFPARKLKNGLPTLSEPGALWYDSSDDKEVGPEKIKKVAVIGAGVSGLLAAKELLVETEETKNKEDGGFEVTVFERDYLPGGIWHYTDEIPLPPNYDHPSPLHLDFTSSPPPSELLPLTEVHSSGYLSSPANASSYPPYPPYPARPAHRHPRPLWHSLKSNTPSPLQQITNWPWPWTVTDEGRVGSWKKTHWDIGRYLRSFAAFWGLIGEEGCGAGPQSKGESGLPQKRVFYNTRVELLEKKEGSKQWTLTLKQVIPYEDDNGYRTEWWQEEFDAVIVTSGRYNSPKIPSIPGLKEWGKTWPEKVIHSRNYRTPEVWANKTVIVIGISVSASEISRDIAPVAGRLFQSVREKKSNNDSNSKFPGFERKFQLRRLPPEAEVIPEIERFERDPHSNDISKGNIILKNGTKITGVDGVIFATGYLFSFPFIPQLNSNATSSYPARPNNPKSNIPSEAPLITSGTHVRSLHLDTFYIPDPTLAFVGLNRLVSDFTWSQYQGKAIARYWNKRLEIVPAGREERWKLHREKVEERGGYTSTFQFYGGLATDAYNFINTWINLQAMKYGGKQVNTLPPYRDEIGKYFSAWKWGIDFLQDGNPKYGDQAFETSTELEDGDFVGKDEDSEWIAEARDW